MSELSQALQEAHAERDDAQFLLRKSQESRERVIQRAEGLHVVLTACLKELDRLGVVWAGRYFDIAEPPSEAVMAQARAAVGPVAGEEIADGQKI